MFLKYLFLINYFKKFCLFAAQICGYRFFFLNMSDTCKDWDIIFMLKSSMKNVIFLKKRYLMMVGNRGETRSTI